ncbi:MAG: Dam family site-specific DNA-(adenine-N6)-methyltransferase [Bacteroidales bacterium]|nr:Dam family site-specific DNA-(adenine-N6)-methyltransferase [Bacteroidales bacterium]
MKGDVEVRFIGSKNTLLTDIEKMVNNNLYGNEQTFLDLFAGTNVVGDYFKKNYTIISNDILYFSYINGKAVIENSGNLDFMGLRNIGIESPLDFLQNNADEYTQKDIIGYYEENYTPTGGAMYLSIENGKRIDYIREQIEKWNTKRLLQEIEYYYLVSTLIEAIPFVSNTTGTYGAYLKHWDKRALKPLELIPLEVQDNGRPNKCYNEDANELIKRIETDIVYVDTPYNNRQYASNYHLLENVARNNKPDLKGITRLFDWEDLRSAYAMKRHAYNAMKDLIKNIDSTHVIVSYNSEGIISEEDLIAIMKENSINNEVIIEKIPYRKYKSKKPSDNYDLYELLLYIRKKEPNKATTIKSSKKEILTKTRWKVEKQAFIKSPLNYIGGKYRLLDQIIPLFPSKINTFVDLFSGGANVGINVEARNHIFNDMNSKINEMFRFFTTQNPDKLVAAIHARIEEYNLSKTNEKGYLKFREHYNKNPNPLDLYVLVSYSYNYQFRFNNSMEFNNPFGRNRSRFSPNMERNLRLFIAKLQRLNAVFTDKLFNEVDLTNLSINDFVYLDPPYLITTGNYNDGNRGFLNWGVEQENQMYELMNQLSKRGIRYALSNVLEHKGKCNELLKNYIDSSSVNVNYLNYNYDNSSYNSKKAGSKEVLITNYNTNTFELISKNPAP